MIQSIETDGEKLLKMEFCETNAKNIFVTFILERSQTEIKLRKTIAIEQSIDIYEGLEYKRENRIAQNNLLTQKRESRITITPKYFNRNFPNSN